MSFGKKIAAVFAVFLILFSIVIGLLAYSYSKNAIQNQYIDHNKLTVQNLSDYYLNNKTTDFERTLNYWAVHPTLIALKSGESVSEADTKELLAEWEGYKHTHKDVLRVYFAPSSGASLYDDADKSPVSLIVPQLRPWYISASETPDQIVWSKPYQDALGEHERIITVSKAVYLNNTVIGVVGMDIRLSELSKMLKELYSKQTGHLTILGPNGETYADSSEVGHEDTVLERIWREDILLTNEGTGIYQLGNRKFVYAFTTEPLTHWTIIGYREIYTAVIFGDLMRMTVFSVVPIIAVMLVAGAMTTKRMLKPLRSVTTAIEQIKLGHWSTRSTVSSKDEIGEISNAFNDMADQIQTMKTALESSLDHIQEGYLETVRALANAIEANDHYTRGHCDRVSSIAKRIAQRAGFSEQQMLALEYASILHDIGKIGVPDFIIKKNGRLTDEEYNLVKRHPQIGWEILKDVPFLDEARVILLQHHEQMNGKGYPQGLSGEAILPEARILAIADAFDAMTSHRPYRPSGMSIEAAVEELKRGCGTQFDPYYVALFVTDEETYLEVNHSKYMQHVG